ncbi:hypothetical protein PGIGA_G00102060 [Pangasianodon gigas]|uniref:Uncharacterized protein n=1 Tax=Pangasianodon gigas TaxID=30993 RepID=A0ACC5XES9_PANGG|nr:hypothetical protein [Pangasianodon gigas]
MFTLNTRMRKNLGDLSDFHRDVVVGSSISDKSQNGVKNKQHPVSGGCARTLLTRAVRGERSSRQEGYGHSNNHSVQPCAQRKLLRRLIAQPYQIDRRLTRAPSSDESRRTSRSGPRAPAACVSLHRGGADSPSLGPRARSSLLFFMPPTNDRGGRQCSGFRVASSSRGSAPSPPSPPPISSRRCVESVRAEEFRGARRTVNPPQGCGAEIISRSLWALCLFCSATASSSLRYCR